MSEQPEGGVFGNLPRSRPGTRSPLREGEHVAQQRETAPKPEPTDETLSATAGQQEAPSEPDQPSEADPGSEQQETAGLEDLAWAGIAAAAEAATIGVRLASRAMEAVRDAGKRT